MKKLVLAIAILVNTSISISQTITDGLSTLSAAMIRDSSLSIKNGDDDTKLMGRFHSFIFDVKVREEFLKHNPKIGQLSIGFNGEKFILIKDWIKLYDFNTLAEKIQDSVYIIDHQFFYEANAGYTLVYGTEYIHIYDSKHVYLKSFTIAFDVKLSTKNPIYNIQTILINDSEFKKEMGLLY